MLNEGQQPYTPTRLQWLAVVLNSTNILGSPIPHQGLSVRYVCDSKRDTIKIIFQHPKELSQETVDGLVAQQRNLVLKATEAYGWDSWVNIEVDVKSVE